MTRFQDAPARRSGSISRLPADLGKRMDRIARFPQAFRDGAANELTVSGDCFNVTGAEGDGDIVIYWTGNITGDPIELARLPGDRFTAKRSADDWTISPLAAPVNLTDADSRRAHYRAVNDRLRSTLAGMNQRHRQIAAERHARGVR